MLALFILAIMSMDFYLPLGIAVGVIYIIPVLFSFVFFSDKKLVPGVVTSIVLVLVILKYLWNILEGAIFWTATINRSFAVFTLFSVFATLTLLHRKEMKLSGGTFVNSFTLRKKFLMILLSILCVFIFSFALTSNYFSESENEYLSLQEEIMTPLSKVHLVREYMGFGCGIHAYKNYLTRNEANYYDKSKTCFSSALVVLQGGVLKDRFPQEVAVIRGEIESYIHKLDEIKQLRATKKKMSIAALDEQVRIRNTSAVDALDDMESSLIARYDEKRQEIASAAKTRGAVVFVLFLGSIVFLYFAVTSISNLINHSVSNLANAANQISKGQLDQKIIRLTSDELGDLSLSLDGMRLRLKENMESLARSNKDLEQFAYVASHDLQEPLRKIMAFGSRLEDSASQNLEEKSKEYLGKIMESSRRMRTLIDDLLVYSRLTTEDIELETVNLNKVISNVIDDLEIRIKESAANITVVHLPLVRANASQMRQLFQNLIGNALKFRKDGIAPRISVGCRIVSGGRLRVSVKDNGIGFDMKYAEKILQPFQRLHNKTEFSGTGIGLAICNRIVSKHGSQFLINSAVGEGSEFSFDLMYDS